MTIETTYTPARYSGNGVTTVFAFNYEVISSSDLVVTLISSTGIETLQTITTNYTVALVGSGPTYDSATITMLTPPASGEVLVIERVRGYTQESDYVTSDPFQANTLEANLDSLTMQTQQLKDLSNRSLKFTATSDTSGINVDLNLNSFKDKILYFDATTGEPVGLDYTDLLAGINGTTSTNTQTLTGDGGKVYTLSFTPANANRLLVAVAGAIQLAGLSYSVSGTTLTFVDNITSGEEIRVTDLSGTELSIVVPSNHITTARLADDAVTTAKITDANVTTGKIADDAITLDKMAGGTDGNLITYNANGDPAYVATGTAGQILTSNGVGAPPTMQARSLVGVAQYSGATVHSGAIPTSYTDLDLSGTVGANRCLVMLSVEADTSSNVAFRPNGEAKANIAVGVATAYGAGCGALTVNNGTIGYVYIITGTDGIVEWIGNAAGTTTTVKLLTYTIL